MLNSQCYCAEVVSTAYVDRNPNLKTLDFVISWHVESHFVMVSCPVMESLFFLKSVIITVHVFLPEEVLSFRKKRKILSTIIIHVS